MCFTILDEGETMACELKILIKLKRVICRIKICRCVRIFYFANKLIRALFVAPVNKTGPGCSEHL